MSAVPSSAVAGAVPERAATKLHLLTNAFSVAVPVRMTLGEFRLWATSAGFPEKLPVHFVDQEILLDMSNEELETHNKVISEVNRVVDTINQEEDLGEFYSDGVLVTNEAAEISSNPDGLLLLWKSLRLGLACLLPREGAHDQYVEIAGRPDWVLEVVSNSSVHKDTVQLRSAYHAAKVPEYWLIDARGQEIDFQILRWQKAGYAAVAAKDGWLKSRVLGRSFRLERRRNRDGRWRYSLLVRSP